MLPARWLRLAALCLPLVASAQSPAVAPVPAAPALVAPDVPAGEDAARMQRLLDAFESLDDVQEVYTNAAIDEAG